VLLGPFLSTMAAWAVSFTVGLRLPVGPPPPRLCVCVDYMYGIACMYILAQVIVPPRRCVEVACRRSLIMYVCSPAPPPAPAGVRAWEFSCLYRSINKYRAPDCKSVVLGSNPAPPQHTAYSVSPEVGSHLG
jgi:hypothetical protein